LPHGSAVGAGILLCQVSEPKEREEDAAGMGAWKIHEANKLTLTNRECCLPTNCHCFGNSSHRIRESLCLTTRFVFIAATSVVCGVGV